ncbi:MAG TPA: neutral zinc metallopeptidase, partial [Ilumatobacteraceae bacterium]|nr:neutral zinc metallopeptidase [Ilumatobacteraceae bacterium]
GTNKEPQPYDEYLQRALADVQDFWRATYPAVYGSTYEELAGGIWASYPGREGNPIPAYPDGCRGDPREMYIAQSNAFYCSFGDYMAYDDFDLIPRLVDDYGETAVGVVFAHEFGHAIQARVNNPDVWGVNAPVVRGEQQADCFAGAWTAHVARGESALLNFGDEGVRAGLSAMVAVKDPLLVLDANGQPVSPDVFEGSAHGTAFDRVGAFQYGFLGGAPACKDMETTPLPLLNIKFTDEGDLAREGNTPYDGDPAQQIDPLMTLLSTDLDRFWTLSVSGFSSPQLVGYPNNGPYPSCPGVPEDNFPLHVFYCQATNQVMYDDGYTRRLFQVFGDFSVGYLISNAWNEAVQTELGSSLAGERRLLINTCLTGAWTGNIIPDGTNTQPFTISPGDLDEAVQVALVLSPEEAISDMSMGSSFEQIDFFRAGVLGGVSECNNRIVNS